MRKLSSLCAWTLLACVLCADVQAAVITLKSGERLAGFVVDERADRLVMRINGADIDVMNEDIVSIEFGETAKQQDLYRSAIQGSAAQAAQAAGTIVPTSSVNDQSIRDRNDPLRKADELEEKRKQDDYERQIKDREQFGKDMVAFFDDLGYDTKDLKKAVEQPDFWDKKP